MRLKLLIILTFVLNTLFGQTVDIDFSGYGTVQNVSGSGPFYNLTIGGFSGSPRFQPDGLWIASDVTVGKVVWLDCARFVITSVGATTINSMIVTVQVPPADWALGITNPLAGQRVAILTEDNGIPTSIPQTGDGNGGNLTGIDNSLYSCILSHYMKAILSYSAAPFTITGSTEISAVATPGNVALDLDQQGAATGQVLKWDGTNWTPSNDLNGGSGAAIDSVIIRSNTNGIEVKVNTTASSYTLVTPLALSGAGAMLNQVLKWNGTDWVPDYDLSSITDLSVTNRTSTGLDIASSDGIDASVPAATTSLAGLMVATDKTKLNFITVTQNVDLDAIEAASHAPVTLGAGSPKLTLLGQQLTLTDVNDADASVTNENLTISDGIDTENLGGQTLIVAGAGGMIVNYTPIDNTLNLSYNESDGDVSNEGILTVTTATGNSSGILSNTSGATAVIIQGTAGILVTESGSTITLTAADNSNSNEGNLSVGAGTSTTSIINSNTSGSGVITLVAGSNITLSENVGTNEITISSTGGAGTTDLGVNNRTSTTLDITSSTGLPATVPSATTTLAGLFSGADKTKLDSDTDQSPTNELQTISVAANTTTLSNSGGSMTIAGAGINVVSTSGSTITVTGTEIDGLITNEGSLTVATGTGTTSIINSNTSGSTGVTITAGAGLTISEIGNVITLVNSDPDQSITNENLTISDGVDTENLGGQTLIIATTGGANANYTPLDNTLTIGFTEFDGDVSNEGLLSVTTATGNSSGIFSNTSGSSTVIIQGTAGILVTESGSTITLTAADNSNANEGNLSVGAGTSTTSIINSNTSGSGVITLVAGTNITLSENVGTNEITINSTGGAGVTDLGVNNRTSTTLDITSSTGLPATVPSATTTLAGLFSGADKTKLDSDTDQSPTNELQIISVAANTTTLSNSGGSMTIAGAGINTVSTSGTTITVTGTEVDGSLSNEGSLTVAAGTGTTSVINSNTTGSTGVTLTAGTGLTISEAGNVITLVNSDPDQSISNENLTISDGTDTENMGGQTLIVSGIGGMVVNYTPVDNTLYLSYNESDSDVSNEGVLTVTTATGNSSGIQSNTSGAPPVIIQGTAGILVTESGNTITLTAADNSNSNEGNLAVGAGGANTATITSNTSGSGVITVNGSSTISVTDNIGTNEITLDLSQQGASTGQVLKWDGTTWAPAADNTGGAGSTDLSIANRTSTTLDVVSSSGIDATVPSATATMAGLMTAADQVKVGFITITQSVDLDALEAASHAAVTVTDNARIDLILTGQNIQADLLQNGATTGQVMKWNGSAWAPGNDAGTTYTAGTGIDVTGTIITNTGDLLNTNEGSLTVTAGTGTTSVISSNTTGSTDVTLTASTGLSISEAGNVITLTNTDPDQSITNELQTIANTSNATSHTATLSSSGGSIQLVEGTGIGLATTGTGLNGVLTITNTGIITEVDGSVTNELQTVANTSDATTHTLTLSNSGGSIQVAEGSGISLTTTGTGLNGVLTIASTSTGITDLTITGTSSPLTLNSSTGTDVTVTAGTGISLTGTSGNMTIVNTGIITEVDGSITNELQTLSTVTNTVTLSNSGGSFTIAGAGTNSVSTSGSTITVTGNGISSTLANNNILIGNVSNVATAVDPSGDADISNTGVILVDRIDNINVTATGATDGQLWRWNNGTSTWIPSDENTQQMVVTGTTNPQLELSDNAGNSGFAGGILFTGTRGIITTNTGGDIDVALPTVGTSGNVLMSNGSTWSSQANPVQSVSINPTSGLNPNLRLSDNAVNPSGGGSIQLVGNFPVEIEATGSSSIIAKISEFGAVAGDVIKFDGTDWAFAPDASGSGATDLTFTGASSPFTLNSSTGTDVTIAQGAGITLSRVSNEITVTAVDQSTTNELQTLSNTSNATSHTTTLSSTGGSVQLVEGTGIALATTGTGLDGVITITNTGIITEVDGSVSNELQTVSNTSDATTHTLTLSNSGGSIQVAEGSGITLTTSGTGLNGILTIASTSTGVTDLTITGTSSPLTVNSSTGTDYTVTAGAGISLTGTSGNMTIVNTGIITEVDGDISNEGSRTVAAGTGTTSIINSNTSGSTGVTLTAGTGLTISEVGNVITLVNSAPDQVLNLTGAGISNVSGTYPNLIVTSTEVDGSVSNELQTLSTVTNTVTLSNAGGSFTIAGAGTNSVSTSGSTITVTGNGISSTLANNNILIGNASNVATAVDPSGDADISNTGVILVDRIDNIDVDATGATDGQIWRWNNIAASWEPTNENTQQLLLTGTTDPQIELSDNDGFSGGAGAMLVIGQRGMVVTNSGGDIHVALPAGTSGQYLKYNGSVWSGQAESTQAMRVNPTSGSAPTLQLSDNAGGYVSPAGTMQMVGEYPLDIIATGSNSIQAMIRTTGAADGDVIKYSVSGGGWGFAPDATGSGAADLTFTGASSPYTLNSSTGTDVTFAQGSGITLSRSSNELTVTAVDASTTNEVLTVTDGVNSEALGGQTLTVTGSGGAIVSYNPATNTLTVNAGSSSGGDNWGSQVVAIGAGLSGDGTAGIPLVATDASTNNEGALTVGVGASNTSLITSNTAGSVAVTLTASTGLSIGESGNVITLTNTDPDQSVTNEIQTISNTSNATSHTATLSLSGGSLQLAEGSGITLTTSGTGLDGVVTIASTSTGATNLAISGTSSPLTVTSDTGTDITLTGGSGITLTGTASNATIIATDPSLSNEGSLTVGAGTSTTSTVTSNTSGSTAVTFEAVASSGLTLTEAGNTISIVMVKVLREETFTSTATQTAFTMAYSAPAVSGTAYPIRVFRNGVELDWVASAPSITQYTFSGTTLTTAANALNDKIRVNYFN